MNVNTAASSMLLHPSSIPANAGSVQLTPAEMQKLRQAGADFESMLLSKWWSSMKEGGLSGEEQTDPGHDTLDQLGMQALSTAVASGGGIGLGALLVRGVLSNATAAKHGATDLTSKGNRSASIED